jgi:CheY-like chemotaxis protein
MGLALSKGLTEAMGGTIGVGSTLDRGSTFWVELALVDEPIKALEDAGGVAPVLALPVGGPVRLILHVEDNLSNLKLVERILARRTDVDLVSAMQGQLGLDLARTRVPDLVLLDLHLPDLSGREILRRLRSYPETRHIPVVIISADATKTQIARLTEEGAVGYLTKPLDVAAFLDLIDRLFGEETARSS